MTRVVSRPPRLAQGADSIQPKKSVATLPEQKIDHGAEEVFGFSDLHDVEGAAHDAKTALVIGGSTAGSAAAVELRLQGFEVVEIDARNVYGREAILNLRPTTIQHTRRIGAFEGLRAFLAPLERYVRVNEQTGKPIPVPVAMPSALTATAKTFQAVAKEAPVAGVKTFGLEMSMRDAALTKGAQLAAGAKATLSDPRGTGERHAELTLEGGAKLDLGFPTLIVVADGANSKTREALGVPFEAKTRELSYMVGLVENRDAECSETLNHTDIDDDDTPLQDIVQTSKEHGQSWVCVQIPARHGDDEQASRRHFENRAKEMLGLPAYVDIKLLTEPQRVGVQHRQASEAVVGQNVVIVGDAFAAGTLATGLGVNAAFRHAEHVGQLAEGLFDGGDRATVMGTFEANMRKTASEMFAPSEPLFAGGDDDG